MIQINDIPQNLLDIHKEWFNNFFNTRVNEIINKNDKNINFVKEVKKWVNDYQKNIAIEKEDEFKNIINSFRKHFKELEKYYIYEMFKEARKEIDKIDKQKTPTEKEYLARVVKERLNELIEGLSNKEELKNIYEKVKINNKNITGFSKDDLKGNIEKIYGMKLKKDEEEKFKVLEYIFSYDEFSKSQSITMNNGKTESWGRHNFLTRLGISVCPYCNRQYINNYTELSENKTTADLDHFYIQKLYPYLALSLYNFIPSCQICNRTFKGATNFFDGKKHNHIYPYKEGFKDNAKFTIDLGNEKLDKKYDLNVLLGISDNLYLDLIIDKNCDDNTKKKIENSIDTFKLDKIYSCNHRDYVKDLIRKAIIYNESRINELYNQYGSLFSSREEVVNMIVSNYVDENDLGKRPLAKLTRDICKELGIK